MNEASSNLTASPHDSGKPRLFLIDTMGYIFRAFHALPRLSNREGHPTQAVYGMYTMLRKLLRDAGVAAADVAVIGYLAVAARLRLLMRRIRQTVQACVAARPDVLVIIDSPGFTHAVASRVRRKLPGEFLAI